MLADVLYHNYFFDGHPLGHRRTCCKSKTARGSPISAAVRRWVNAITSSPDRSRRFGQRG